MRDGDLVKVVREPERPTTVYVGRLGLVDGVPLNGRALVHFIDPAGPASQGRHRAGHVDRCTPGAPPITGG